MIKEIWAYILKKKWTYLVVLLCVFIGYGTTIFPTRVTQRIINEIAANTLTRDLLKNQLFILALTTFIMYAAEYLWVKLLFNSKDLYQRDMKKKLFKKLSRMRIPFYEKFRSGDMMTRFTSDITSFSELLGYGTMSLFYGLGTLLIIIPQMFILHWWISLLSMVPLLLLGYLVFKVGEKQDEAVDLNREAVANLSNEVLEVVDGIRVTRAYGNSELGFHRFKSKTKALRKRADDIMFYQAMYGRLSNVLLAVSAAIILGLGGYSMAKGQLEVGDVVALQMYSWILLEPMWMLSDFILVYKTGKLSFDKLHELLDVGDDLEVDGKVDVERIDSIRFQNYSFNYASSNHHSLKDLNLEIHGGQTLGIVGKTGSGKTTLIRQLLRQYPVGQGQMLINGRPIQDFKRQSIERQIGYVPQEHVLFSRTVEENIRVGKQEASQKELDYAVAVASFMEDVGRMREGYQTLVGEKGVSVSGGQKQRISIARAIIKNPNLLILDDSLSAVDAKTERVIIENIKYLRKGKMNIIVTHRLSAVNHADWVIVLDDGKIVEAGDPRTLLEQKGWYASQYEKQQKEEDSQDASN